jgi:hypothetical protein
MFFELLLYTLANFYIEDISEEVLEQIAIDAGWNTTEGSIQDWAYKTQFC